MALKLFWYILAVPVVLIIRIIRPWLLVRWCGLISSRIGHFVANTELYFCERDAGINVPRQPHVDLFYMESSICNQQLATMWKRVLRVWPYSLLARVSRLNRMLPGGDIHEIGNNAQNDRDIHNLLDRFPAHLDFTPEEEARGEAGLRALGIPVDARFVCLHVRDGAYLDSQQKADWSSHDYRNNDIQKFVKAAEELAERGFYVLRMGAKVIDAIKTDHPKIIDYAANGMRSDFMDIYIGSKCEFCIGTCTGWDLVPAVLFRRHALFTNLMPLGYLPTYSDKFIFTTKRHVLAARNRELSLSEIFEHGVGFCLETSDYSLNGIELVENTPEEIRDVVFEVLERLNNTWQPHEDDDNLQQRFWEIFPKNALDVYYGKPLHGEIRARFGAHYLRNNRDWLK